MGFFWFRKDPIIHVAEVTIVSVFVGIVAESVIRESHHQGGFAY
jgi:hypothetical protein